MAGISTSVTDTDPANVDPSTGISNGEPGTTNAPIITEGETALYAGADPVTEPETDAEPDNRTPGIYVGTNLDPAPSLYVDGEKVVSTYDPVTGRLTPVVPLEDGDRNIAYTLTDAAGNESQQSDPLEIVIDGAPDAPVVNTVTDQVGTVTGAIVAGGVTNDTQPLFTGTGEAGATIVLKEANTIIGTTIVRSDGNWSVSPTAALADGAHSLTVVQIDPTGHESRPSAAFNLNVDTVYSGPEPVNVPVNPDHQGLTTPAIYVGEGLNPAPSLYVDGKKVEAIYDDVGGTLTPVQPVSGGLHTLTYALTDAAGNESAQSASIEFFVFAEMAPPVLTVVTDEMGYVARIIESNVATTDTQPVFHGTGGSSGARLSLQSGGVEIGWAVVARDGTWSITPDVPLTDGSYTLTLMQLEVMNGKSGLSAPFHLIVDTHVTGPVIQYIWATAEPSIEPVKTFVATGETNNTRPVISGAGGGAGSTIRLMDRNAIIGTAIVAADGTWNVQPTAALSDGVHSFTVVAVDKAGKVLGASSAVALTIDTHYNGPDPEVAPVTDQPGVAYPPIEVPKGLEHAPVLYVDGVKVESTYNKYTGFIYVSNPLTPGNHVFSYALTDAAGNESARFREMDAEPGAPVLDTVSENVGAYKGPIEDGHWIDDTRPVFAGHGGQAGATIELMNGGTVIGTAIVAHDGTWSVQPSAELADGRYSLNVVQVSKSGVVSASSASFSFQLEALPHPPVLTVVTDEMGYVARTIESNVATTDTQPVFHGAGGSPGAFLDLLNGNVLIGGSYVRPDGTWSVTPTVPLTDGSYILTLIQNDIMRGKSELSAPFHLIVDTHVSEPVIQYVWSAAKPSIEPVETLVATGETNNTRPVISGAGGGAGSTIRLMDGNAVIGSTTVAADGTWNVQPTAALSDGVHSFTVVAVDQAGKVIGGSSAVALTIDTHYDGPAPDVAPVTDQPGVRYPYFEMPKGLEHAPVLYVDGVKVETTYDKFFGFLWLTNPITPGNHVFSYALTDAAGNESAQISQLNAQPNAPVLDTVSDNVGPYKGPIADGDWVDDARPVFSGHGGQAGATIELWTGGTVVGTAMVANDGSWSVQPSTELADGRYSLSLVQVSKSGIVSASSESFRFDLFAQPEPPVLTVVTDEMGYVARTIQSNVATTDTQPVFHGTSGSRDGFLELRNGDVVIGMSTVEPDGTWSIVPEVPLADGSYTLTLIQRDIMKGDSELSKPFHLIVDTHLSGPVIQYVWSAAEPSIEPVETLVATGETNNTRPVISGAGGGVGSTIRLMDGNAVIGSTTVAADGTWNVQPTAALSDGVHSFTVVAVDQAGKVIGASSAVALTVDTHYDGPAPDVAPVIAQPSDSYPTIAVPKGLDHAPNLYVDGVKVETTYDKFRGFIWLSNPLTPGTHVFSYTLTDAAGNESAQISQLNAQPNAPVLDTVSDNFGPHTGLIQNSGSTDDPRPVFSGHGGQAGATIELRESDGTVIGTAMAANDGSWSVQPSYELLGGNHSLNLVQITQSGTVSTSISFEFLLQHEPPVLTVVTDEMGYVARTIESNVATTDTQPVFHGTGGARGASISLQNGGVEIGWSDVAPDGTWTVTPTVPLTDGSYTLTLMQRDLERGDSALSAPFHLIVDTHVTGPVIQYVSATAEKSAEPVKPVFATGETNNTHPVISGAGGGVGSTIRLMDGNAVIGSTIVAADGAWNVQPTAALSDGVHSFTVVAVDQAGKVIGASSAVALTVDTHYDGLSPATAPTTSASTVDHFPAIDVGVGLEHAPNLYVDGVKVESVYNPYTGFIFLSNPLANGTHVITYSFTDAAGNESTQSGQLVQLVDGSPDAPLLDNVRDSVGIHQGSIISGALTDDARSVFSGHGGEAGATIELREGVTKTSAGTVIGTAIVASDGTWSVQPSTALADGYHSLSLLQVTKSGHSSLEREDFNLTIDTHAPTQSIAFLHAGEVGATTMTTPTLSGTLSASLASDEVIQVSRDGTVVGTAKADGTSWSFADINAPQGKHVYTAQLLDFVGNMGASSTYTITFDDKKPKQSVVIDSITDDIGMYKGTIGNGGLTDDTSIKMSGTLSGVLGTGDVVNVYRNGTFVKKATVDGTSWSVFLTGLTDGDYSYTAKVVNTLGLDGTQSNTFGFTVDTIAPTKKLTFMYGDDAGAWQYAATATSLTDDATPKLLGTLSAALASDEFILVRRNNVILGTATVTGNSWTYQDGPLADAAYTYTAQIVDKAGNVGAGLALYVTVDTKAPTKTSNATMFVDSDGQLQGAFLSGAYTDAKTPRILGVLSASLGEGETVQVLRNGTVLGNAGISGLNWFYNDKLSADGTYYYTARVINGVGNYSTVESTGLTLTLDRTAPTQVAPIAYAVDDFGSIQGVVTSNGYTNDKTPTLSGTLTSFLAPGEYLQVLREGTIVGTATVFGKNWSFTDSGLASATSYAYATRIVDQVGNVGAWSPIFTLSITQNATFASLTDDVGSVTGVLLSGRTTDDNSPTFTGTLGATLTAQQYIQVYRDDVLLGTATVSGALWTYADSQVADGNHYYYTRLVEKTGFVGDASPYFTMTVDTVAPTQVPTISYFADNVAPLTGKFTSGKFTNDTTPTFAGTLQTTLDAGDFVQILRGGKVIGSATVSGTSWKFADSGLVDGASYGYTARVADLAGHVGPTSSLFTVAVDTTAPTQAVTWVSTTDDQGASTGLLASGKTTDDNSLTFGGTLSAVLGAGELVQLLRDGTVVASTTTTSTSWTITDATRPADGKYSYTIQIADAAGNVGATTTAREFTIDTSSLPKQTVKIASVTDNVGPQTGIVESGDWTNDSTPTLKGTISSALLAGQTVKIWNGSTLLGIATVTGTSWTYVDASSHTTGQSMNYSARVVDSSNNLGALSASYIVNYDNVASVRTLSLTKITDNFGTAATLVSGSTTDDNTPTFTGKTSALAANEFIQFYANGDAIGTATVSGTSWTFTPVLANGTYFFAFGVVDMAGNASAMQDGGRIVINAPSPKQVATIEGGFVDVDGTVYALGLRSVTNDTTPQLVGSLTSTLLAGQTLHIFRSGKDIGTASVVGKDWVFTDSGMADGAYGYTAQVVDIAGNKGTLSSAFTVTIDTTPPAATGSVSTFTDHVGSVTGDFPDGIWTDDKAFTLNGTLSSNLATGERVAIFRDGVEVSTAVVSVKSWSYTTSSLADGTYAFSVKTKDSAGNYGAESGAFVVSVDTTHPAQTVTFSHAVAEHGASNLMLANASLTDDTSPTLFGGLSSSLQSGDYVQIMRDNLAIGVASVTGTNWSYTDNLPAGGNHVYTAHVVSHTGQTGSESAEFSLTVLPNFTISGNVFSFGEGNHTLDLTKVPDGLLSGVETIDIGGNGANTINLNEHDVLDMTGTTQILKIKGTGDDTVRLDGNAHFALSHQGYVDGKDGTTYDVYQNSSNGTLVYIDHDINNVILI